MNANCQGNIHGQEVKWISKDALDQKMLCQKVEEIYTKNIEQAIATKDFETMIIYD